MRGGGAAALGWGAMRAPILAFSLWLVAATQRAAAGRGNPAAQREQLGGGAENGARETDVNRLRAKAVAAALRVDLDQETSLGQNARSAL